MCHGNLVCSGSSLLQHSPYLAEKRQGFQKGAFLQWPPQLWIETALLSKHPLTTDQIYWCKQMYVQILLCHCPRICATQNTWCDCLCGFKNCKHCTILFSFMNSFTGPHLTLTTQNQATLDISQLKPNTKIALLVWQRLTYLKGTLAMTSWIQRD